LQNRDRLNAELDAITRTRPSADWIDLLNQAGVPCGPIYNIDQVFDDPQVRHIGIARAVDDPRRGRRELVGQAVELSRTPWALRTAAPEKGEHTAAVLESLGYNAAAITDLRKRGVI
jgi:formyl-CoA transferase